MKVIQFYKDEKQLIKKAVAHDREAQRLLYEKHAPKMLSVCRQYIKDIHHAEEIMMNGFFKVFTNLKKFKYQGSFEGWIRRIMINEAISFLRKKNQLFFTDDVTVYAQETWNNTQIDLDVAQIQNLIDKLPEGYKMVFVLYAIEGYKHQEIAKMLNISESTSKTQLFKARKLLQKKLNQQNKTYNGSVEV